MLIVNEKIQDRRQTDLKAMRLCYIGIQNCWVPIEKCQTDISIKKGSASASIKRTHFAMV